MATIFDILKEKGIVSSQLGERLMNKFSGNAAETKQDNSAPVQVDAVTPHPVAEPTPEVAPVQSEPTPVTAEAAPAIDPFEQQLAQIQQKKAETAAHVKGAFDKQSAGLTQQAEAESEAAKKSALELEKVEKKLNESTALAEAEDKVRKERLQNQFNLLQEQIEKNKSIPATTQQAFANKSTGGKILTGIAAFFGAAGGGENSAVAALQKAVDGEIAKAKQMTDDQNLLYNQMRSMFGDERAAEAATRASIIENMKVTAERIANQSKSKLVQGKLQELLGKLDIEQQKALSEFGAGVSADVEQALYDKDQDRVNVFTKITNEEHRKNAIKELGDIRGAQKITDRINEIMTPENAAGGKFDAAAGQKLRAEVRKEVDAYIASVQKLPAEKEAWLARLDSVLSDKNKSVEEVREMAVSIVQNLTQTPTLSAYQIRPKFTGPKLKNPASENERLAKERYDRGETSEEENKALRKKGLIK